MHLVVVACFPFLTMPCRADRFEVTLSDGLGVKKEELDLFLQLFDMATQTSFLSERIKSEDGVLKKDVSGYFTLGYGVGSDETEDQLEYTEDIIKKAIQRGEEATQIRQLDEEYLSHVRASCQSEHENNLWSLSGDFNLGMHLLMNHPLAGVDDKGCWLWPEACPDIYTSHSVDEIYKEGTGDTEPGEIQKMLASSESHSLLGNCTVPYTIVNNILEAGANAGALEASANAEDPKYIKRSCTSHKKSVEDGTMHLTYKECIPYDSLKKFALIMLVS